MERGKSHSFAVTLLLSVLLKHLLWEDSLELELVIDGAHDRDGFTPGMSEGAFTEFKRRLRHVFRSQREVESVLVVFREAWGVALGDYLALMMDRKMSYEGATWRRTKRG